MVFEQKHHIIFIISLLNVYFSHGVQSDILGESDTDGRRAMPESVTCIYMHTPVCATGQKNVLIT